MNRVTTAIEKMRKAIADQIASGQILQSKADSLHKTLDMEWDEYVKFQELKSAMMGTALTTEEAMTIYGYLGEGGPDKFNQAELAVKVVLTKMFEQLMRAQIGGRV